MEIQVVNGNPNPYIYIYDQLAKPECANFRDNVYREGGTWWCHVYSRRHVLDCSAMWALPTDKFYVTNIGVK